MDIFYPIIGKQKCLPFYLSGIGVTDPEYHIVREKGLISHQILFTKAGAGELLVDGKKYILGKGSLFYIAPQIPHEYYPQKQDDWTTCWLVFRGDNLADIMPAMGFHRCIVEKSIVHPEIEKKFQRILSVIKDPIDGDERASLLLYDYLLTIRLALQEKEKRGRYHQGSLLDAALIYMEENYARDISLEDLANISVVTKQHFCRLFKARMGMRPLEYLARKRVAVARGLLMNTQMSVAEIGRQVGYDNPTYFGMVYKKYEGISPSEYRKKGGSA